MDQPSIFSFGSALADKYILIHRTLIYSILVFGHQTVWHYFLEAQHHRYRYNRNSCHKDHSFHLLYLVKYCLFHHDNIEKHKENQLLCNTHSFHLHHRGHRMRPYLIDSKLIRFLDWYLVQISGNHPMLHQPTETLQYKDSSIPTTYGNDTCRLDHLGEHSRGQELSGGISWFIDRLQT